MFPRAYIHHSLQEMEARDITKLHAWKKKGVGRCGTARWQYFAYDKEDSQWVEVQRDQIDHIVVQSKEMGGGVLAVNVVEWNCTTYSASGAKEQKGKSLQLPTGSRHSPTSTCTPPQPGDEDAVPGGLGVASCPVPSAVPVLSGFCVRNSFAALGWPIPLPEWVDFKTVQRLIAEDREWNRRMCLLKPNKWGYPALLGSGGCHSPFSFNAIDVLCEQVSPIDQFVLRVHLFDSNNSLHCIAVTNGVVIDPHHGTYPLCKNSFEGILKVDEIIDGYKIRALK